MMEEKTNGGETFAYSYSAKRQAELEAIRSKYTPRQPDKMEQLRALDRSAGRKGTIAAIIVGVVGTLTLGFGMCCTMVWPSSLFIPGIFIGVAGIVLIVVAHPLYVCITKRERKKIAPEILRLTEELSREAEP